MSKNATEQTVEDLVIRARLGDQIASSTLVIIGKESTKGNKRASEIKDMVIKYTNDNPMTLEGSTVFGIDNPPKDSVIGDACLFKRNLNSLKFSGAGLAVLILTLGEFAIPILVKGPSLLQVNNKANPIIIAVRDALSSSTAKQAFDYGNQFTNDAIKLEEASKTMPEEALKAFHLGVILGRSRRFQAIMNPSVPFEVLDKDINWELGD